MAWTLAAFVLIAVVAVQHAGADLGGYKTFDLPVTVTYSGGATAYDYGYGISSNNNGTQESEWGYAQVGPLSWKFIGKFDGDFGELGNENLSTITFSHLHLNHTQLSGSLKADDRYGCSLGASVCSEQAGSSCQAGLTLNPQWPRQSGEPELRDAGTHKGRELEVLLSGAFTTAAYYNNIPPNEGCSRPKTFDPTLDDRFLEPNDIGQTLSKADKANAVKLAARITIAGIHGSPAGCKYVKRFLVDWPRTDTLARQQAVLAGDTYVGAQPHFKLVINSSVTVQIHGKRTAGGRCGHVA